MTLKNKNLFETKTLKKLKEQGFRITKTRKALVQLLSATRKPLAPNEIFLLLNKIKSGTSIDLASVYRILDVLVENKLIHKDNQTGAYFPCQHCENCNSEEHIFIKCDACGGMEELDYHHQIFSKEFLNNLKAKNINLSNKILYLTEKNCSSCE